MPLPPYIAARRAPDTQDRADYQTLFARHEGAVAAPTAGLHFTDALRARLRQCWMVPVGLADARDLIITVRIQFNKDGSLATDPHLTNTGSHPAFQVAAESALRAVRSCAPYTFLPVAKYDAWKDIIVDFDPRDMFRG